MGIQANGQAEKPARTAEKGRKEVGGSVNRTVKAIVERKHGSWDISVRDVLRFCCSHDEPWFLPREVADRVKSLFQRVSACFQANENGTRSFWIDVSRPGLAEWLGVEGVYEDEVIEVENDVADMWRSEYPRGLYWFEVIFLDLGSKYHIQMTDHKSSSFTWVLDDEGRETHEARAELRHVLQLFDFFEQAVQVIGSDTDDYISYVNRNLPYQQRTGRIDRKAFNQLFPESKVCVADLDKAVRVLESTRPSVQPPVVWPAMTIRRFCRCFRVAHAAYLRSLAEEDAVSAQRRTGSDELDDLAYYRRVALKYLPEGCDVDSEADFLDFATDHYGELCVSRINVCPVQLQGGGWVFTVSNSYSSTVSNAIRVSMALEAEGVPLRVYDAEKMLRILREEDRVLLCPSSYHDYLNSHPEGSAFELPWEYEVGDEGAEKVPEQLQKLIDLAEWDPVELNFV